MADWLTWDGGGITADAITAIDVEAEVELTDHPIESGGVITDHQIRRPRTIDVEFTQSRITMRANEQEWTEIEVQARESLFKPTGLLALSRAVGDALGAVAGALGLGGDAGTLKIWRLTAKDPDRNRIQEIHDQLLELLEASTEVTLSYQDLVLTGYRILSVKRSIQAGSGGAGKFSVRLREVKTVETATAPLGELPAPAALSAIPVIDFGRKGVEAIEEEVVTHSLGQNDLGLDSLGGFL